MKREYYIQFTDGAIAYGTPCAEVEGTLIGSQQCITCPYFTAIYAIDGQVECHPARPKNKKTEQLTLNF